jgi:acyl-CoA thioesterase II
MDQDAVDALIDLLDLEELEVNIFRGQSPDEKRQRVYGGQVAGQALVAAVRTVSFDRVVHSLHGYFLRSGEPGVPILYDVERVRDGRSFTTRRVRGIQQGQVIFNLSASFQMPERGFEHQFPMPLDLPDPDDLPDFTERMAPWAEELGDWYTKPRAIDTRYCEWRRPDDDTPRPPFQHVWFKANGKLPDGQVLHTCVATYASDMTVLDTSLLPHHNSGLGQVFMASLDHAMWFHRPFRADEWLLYAQDSPNMSSARGFSRGSVFTSDGVLVASVAQEGLLRIRRPKTE